MARLVRRVDPDAVPDDPGFRWCGPDEEACGWPSRRDCRRCDRTCDGRRRHSHFSGDPRYRTVPAVDPALLSADPALD